MDKIFANCKYRDRIIIPLLGLSPNYDFSLLSDKEKQGVKINMKDGIIAKVRQCNTRSIFDLEQDIQELYNVSAWEYLCRWNNACEKQIASIYLWDIYLEKA